MTTEAKTRETMHTPGPWVVVRGKNGWPVGVNAPHDMKTPGGVGGIIRQNGIGLPSSPAAEANARLIAAAPDLLEALKVCVAMIDASMALQVLDDGVYEAGVTDVEMLPGGGYMLSQARAALKKAGA